jgi:hypothetical protein
LGDSSISISVDAGDGRLRNFVLPNVPKDEDLKQAIIASLSLLDLAPPEVVFPLFAALYRAPLSECAPVDFSIFVAGPTGAKKTAVTALVQQHFGSLLDSRNLPAN